MPAVTHHVVRVFRRVGRATTPYREKVGGWQLVADGVECDIQPRTGQVEQGATGRTSARTAMAFLATGTDIRPDDGIEVVKGLGPKRYLVIDASDWGPPGDLELQLQETAENFE